MVFRLEDHKYDAVYFEDENGQSMVRPKLKKSLNYFLISWLKNIKEQGFLAEKAGKENAPPEQLYLFAGFGIWNRP